MVQNHNVPQRRSSFAIPWNPLLLRRGKCCFSRARQALHHIARSLMRERGAALERAWHSAFPWSLNWSLTLRSLAIMNRETRRSWQPKGKSQRHRRISQRIRRFLRWDFKTWESTFIQWLEIRDEILKFTR